MPLENDEDCDDGGSEDCDNDGDLAEEDGVSDEVAISEGS